MITLGNVHIELVKGGVIQKERVYNPSSKWRTYKLLKSIDIELSNGIIVHIPEGFDWDLSSVPKLLWCIFPPDGDFEIAALVHDYLYRNKLISRRFADKEMLTWSNKVNFSKNMAKVDNYLRYLGVRLFGKFVWKN